MKLDSSYASILLPRRVPVIPLPPRDANLATTSWVFVIVGGACHRGGSAHKKSPAPWRHDAGLCLTRRRRSGNGAPPGASRERGDDGRLAANGDALRFGGFQFGQ